MLKSEGFRPQVTNLDVDVDKPDEKSIMTYVAALSRRLGSAIDVIFDGCKCGWQVLKLVDTVLRNRYSKQQLWTLYK